MYDSQNSTVQANVNQCQPDYLTLLTKAKDYESKLYKEAYPVLVRY